MRVLCFHIYGNCVRRKKSFPCRVPYVYLHTLRASTYVPTRRIYTRTLSRCHAHTRTTRVW
jgi:hypothetical protein